MCLMQRGVFDVRYDKNISINHLNITLQSKREEIFRSVDEIGEGKFNSGSLVPIMLRSEEGWQVSAFICTIMRCRVEMEWIRQ